MFSQAQPELHQAYLKNLCINSFECKTYSLFVQDSIFDPNYGLLLQSQEVTKIDIITEQEQKTQRYYYSLELCFSLSLSFYILFE
jgi:hypothetical protein